jgi:hypothetical protein
MKNVLPKRWRMIFFHEFTRIFCLKQEIDGELAAYNLWAKDNGYRQMNHKNFVAELRLRHDVRWGGVGYVVVGVEID